LKGINWPLLKAENLRAYQTMLQDAKRKDDDLVPDDYIPNLRDYFAAPPIDSKFFQSHDVSSYFSV
jgi:hypothetical protein